MSLASGVRLGPYEIVSAIGAGGMGEVYRARDTRLGRDVAIKILPEAFINDADRLARFEREARIISQLNHPNICALYHISDAPNPQSRVPTPDSIQFLVLELVDGPTLADRIAQGPVPLDEAILIARQIADALEAAHEQGVIHRDLKPANIKLKADGTVKVLDFGLAKALGPAEAGPHQNPDAMSLSPTMTSPAATRVGVILGTAAYMSPEQARGKTVDKRSDIWAFGCVLYEMLTGKPAFDGEDVSLTLSKILQREPDWAALPQTVPPAVRQLLLRCLEKDPKRRLRDIGDARMEIDAPITAPPLRPDAGRHVLKSSTAWGLAGLAVGVVAAGLFGWISPAPAETPRRVARFAVIPQSEMMSAAFQDIAISSKGTRIVYVVESAGATEFRVRDIGQVESKTIAGTRHGLGPFFSPAGDQIGFEARRELRLKRVPIGGGPPAIICSFDGETDGVSWGQDGTIVFAQVGGKPGLLRVSALGGSPEFIATPDPKKNEREYRHPYILPGGKTVLFTIVPLRGGIDAAQVAVRSLVTGDQKVLIEGGTDAAYVPTGHLVYARNGGLSVVPFDLSKLEVTGTPVAIQDDVVTTGTGAASFAFSDDGSLVYLPGTSGPSRRLVWVTRDGKNIDPIPSAALSYARYPRLSADGRRLAITLGASFAGDIWVYDLDSERQPIPLTFEGHDVLPVWSPDGKTVVFQSNKLGPRNLFSIPADGSAQRDERLLTSERQQIALDWSPDGSAVLFEEIDTETLADLWILPLQGNRKPAPWLQTRFSEVEGRFSPNGRWVAYVSDQTGRSEVWVRAYPGPSAPIGISSDGGHEPVWARDGRELYYQSGTRLMSVRVLDTASAFRFEAPRVVLDGGFVPSSKSTPRTYDTAPDGRLLMIQPLGETGPSQFVLVQNWFEELKQRVASR